MAPVFAVAVVGGGLRGGVDMIVSTGGGAELTGDEDTVVGRMAELEAMRMFVDSLVEGPAMLVLAGEAGIGKSTVWREGLRLAEARGFEVLQCRPVQSEAQLAFTGLSDLLADVPHSAFDVLPVPQRRALKVALLLAEPEGDEFHPRAVGLGLIGLLAARAAQHPVVLGIDDAHWLDQASQRVLAFVARRLRRERIGLLATSRADSGRTIIDDVDNDAGIPVTLLRLTGLEPGDVEQILRGRLGEALGRRAVARVQQSSGGNPFFALQIGLALVERDPAAGDVDLPIPASLQQMVGDRLTALGPAISIVQAAAATSRPTTTLITALFGPRRGPDGIRAAVAAGVLAVDGDRLAFTHPLLATAAYAGLDRDECRRLHAKLAAQLDDVEERARHLAVAADHPAADVAEALDIAARRARARYAPDAAAELWETAARLTPADEADGARARRLEAAQCRIEMGEVERARAMFEDILNDAPPGPTRGRVLWRWAWAVAHTEGFEAGARAFRDVLPEVEDQPLAEIEVQQGLAWCLHESSGLAMAEPHARRALALAESSKVPRLIAGAATLVAFLGSLTGNGLAVESVERAVETNKVGEWPQILGRPDWIHGLLLEWEDHLASARAHFRRIHDEAVDRGDEHSLPYVLFHLARTELLMGEWTRARRSAEACAETSLSSGMVTERPFACVIVALVEAHFGAVDAANAKIVEGLELADRFAVRPAEMELLATRGFVELSLSQFAAADRTFSELDRIARSAGLLEPALFRYHGDAIEAKIALGRLDQAAELLDAARALATALERPWLQLVVARGTGLLEAARGHPDAASAVLATALRHDRLGQPFERARTMLVLGSVQRRNRKKRDARQALTNASDVFERLGARLWVERTAAELARIGGRAPAEGLTPTELRVAELIAAGRTYREAAAELFISPKTVQWNLSKVYRKLGIRSRTELPGRLKQP